MTSQKLPWMIEKVIVPPIKCQGIKTKLVKFILSNTSWSGKGRWVEPFWDQEWCYSTFSRNVPWSTTLTLTLLIFTG